VDNNLSYSKDLKLFFRTRVKEALGEHKLTPTEEVEFYLVNILFHFSKTDNLYPCNEDGKREDRALALKFADAVFTLESSEKFQHFKTLGDSALYHAGVFYEGFQNKVVDVGYYIKMGGIAYNSLANLSTGNMSHLADMFQELSLGFEKFVEVLSLSCKSDVSTDFDLLKLLDTYLKTGSPKAKKILEEKGIIPASLDESVQ